MPHYHHGTPTFPLCADQPRTGLVGFKHPVPGQHEPQLEIHRTATAVRSVSPRRRVHPMQFPYPSPP